MRHNLWALVIATLIMAMLLWTIAYSGNLTTPEHTIQVRKLSSVTLPVPPPPPPPVTQNQQKKSELRVNLNTLNTGSRIELKVSPLAVELPRLAVPQPVLTQNFGLTENLSAGKLKESLTTFSLQELDELPELLSRLRTRLPGSLTRQGLSQAKVVLHIIIHENGQPELVAVSHLPYNELEPLVRDLIRQARFSAPVRQGAKVKAEFLWPVIIKA